MEKFPTPGIPSSARPAGSEALKRLAHSERLAPLLKALGQGAAPFIVGGAVRDALTGKEPEDLDIACALSPAEMASKLKPAGLRVVETGIRHGTITVVMGKENIEITSFRTVIPGVPATILTDLQARDFTINAIAYDPIDLAILDPENGAADLEARLLRAVGDARERFREDPLRIMRMIRFGPAQGFQVEEETLKAAAELSGSITSVSIERVRGELERILVAPRPAAGLRAMLQTGLMKHVLPEALASVGFEQNRFHYQDVFEHTLAVVERCPADPLLRLVALFHDLGKPASLSVTEDGERHFYEHEVISERLCKQAMTRLRFSREQIEDAAKIVRLHMRPVECGPSGVRRLMRELRELFGRWREFKYADATPTLPDAEIRERLAQFDKMVAEESERLQKEKSILAINGYDLIAQGMEPGPKMGRVLKALEELVIEDPSSNERDTLLREAKRFWANTPDRR